MASQDNESFFHACYREASPLPRSACDHELYPAPNPEKTGCQFAKISSYLFGLTTIGLDMFKCFLENPDLLVSRYGWDPDVISEIRNGASWTGERLSFPEAMNRMKELADNVFEGQSGEILFLFSKNKVDFNVEIYSTPGLDFIEGFIIAAADSENYREYFSLIVNEANIIEIECDYGLNEPPDDNPWGVLYDGDKLSFCGQEIWPEQEN